MPLIWSSAYRCERMPNARMVSPVLRCRLFARLVPMMQEFVSDRLRF